MLMENDFSSINRTIALAILCGGDEQVCLEINLG